MAGLDQAPPPARITLVLGGARSGKSAHAEALLEGHAGSLLYIATAEPRDAEMGGPRRGRIAPGAGPSWRTVEAPLAAGRDAGGRKPPPAPRCWSIASPSGSAT